MSSMLVVSLLAVAGLLTVALLLMRVVWGASLAAGVVVALGLLLFEISAARPLLGVPPTPFILWAANDNFAWAANDREEAPRTWNWQVPSELLRALRDGNGTPLWVDVKKEEEGKGGKLRHEEEDTPGGEFSWTLLEPDNPVK